MREQQPDLVLLQEVWVGSYLRALQRLLEMDYESIYQPRPLTRWPRGGLVVLVHRRRDWVADLPVFVMYPAWAPAWRLWQGDGISGKGLLAVRLRRNGEILGVVNTHLQSQYRHSGHAYVGERASQLDMLRDFVVREYADDPALIAGDFNTAPEEPIYAERMTTLGTDVTSDLRQRCEDGTHIDGRSGASEWIDYVIARNMPGGAAVHRILNQAADHPFSDHHALLVRFTNGQA